MQPSLFRGTLPGPNQGADHCRPTFPTNRIHHAVKLSKKYHPDIVKDNASQTKFHAVSEAYAVLTLPLTLPRPMSRRKYHRAFGSSFQTYHTPGQHPQATTTRPSQQHSFKHVWPNHPRNRTRDPMGSYPNAARYDHLHEHARASNSGSRIDPFMSPLVQRVTGRRRAESAFASQSDSTPPHFRQGGFQSASSVPPWTGSGSEGRRTSAADGRPTRDEAAAESWVMRALGASGLVGVIMLIAAIMGQGNAKRTS
ncbi:hypothetical protein L210DRAFT_3649100 [Boletus edulis BED1]|uniref:J domain-containing protein n=1 Tax=Boletus edulis BED1 TaxID=1328754 RepID=A0AAD4BMZ6_BOLED|nr:hypothetical protein L210DRAFT_3649100 [Boletus edulis BED1]